MSGFQMVHDFLQVNSDTILLGFYVDMAFVVDSKKVYTPSLDVVELLRVFNSPFLHLYCKLKLMIKNYMPVACLSNLTLSPTFSLVSNKSTSKIY